MVLKTSGGGDSGASGTGPTPGIGSPYPHSV